MTKKKLLSLLLAVCMVLSLLPAGLISAFADGDEIAELQLGLNDVYAPFNEISETDGSVIHNYTIYSFTPESSALYWFCSFSVHGTDPWCTITDADDNDVPITSGNNDDYPGNGENFNFMFSAELTAGNTYYIGASHYEVDSDVVTDLAYKLFVCSDDSFGINSYINVDDSIVIAPPRAEEGEEVPFMLYPETPEDGSNYDISITYEEPDLGYIDVEYAEENGIYTFEMPPAAVEISVSSAHEPISFELKLGVNNVCAAESIDEDDLPFNEFYFTPALSGTYCFSSFYVYDNTDPVCYITDSSGNNVETQGELDDYNANYGFKDFMFTASLTADETYSVFIGNRIFDHHDVVYKLYISSANAPVINVNAADGYTVYAPPYAEAGEETAFRFTPESAPLNQDFDIYMSFEGADGNEIRDVTAGKGYYYFEMPDPSVSYTEVTINILLTGTPLDPQDAIALTIGDNDISSNFDGYTLYSFTSAEGGTYSFTTIADDDTYAVLLDSDLKGIYEVEKI